MESSGILVGLAVMFLWGIGNFIQAIPIKKIGSLKVILFFHGINLIIFLPISIVLFFLGYIKTDSLSIENFEKMPNFSKKNFAYQPKRC